MPISSRDSFTSAQSSEKIILAQVEGTRRLLGWTLHSGNIYYKDVVYFVVGLYEDVTELTEAASLGAVTAGKWYYDSALGRLYVETTGSTDPADEELIVTYRLFYANAPVTASHDLTATGKHVEYKARIMDAPGYKHKIGVDQKLVSTVGSGNLKLENTDGDLDDIFDTLYFENKEVRIYSWHRNLTFTDAKIIFRGRVTNKVFTEDTVTFKLKDAIFDLLQNVPQDAYTDADNVADDIKGRYKRKFYGRVDGLRIQSIDQIADGYALTGTVSAVVGNNTLVGIGTAFYSEVSPDDTITIGTQEFKVAAVNSDTQILLQSAPTYTFSNQSATIVPDIPTTSKNRTFLVAGHACTTLQKTVTELRTFNRVILSDVDGLQVGDFIEFATGERIEIKTVVPFINMVVLRKNVIVQPSVGSVVTRQPVQNVYIGSTRVESDDFTVSNLGSPTNQCTITLSSTAEYNLAKVVSLGFTATFTNGLRSVTTSDNIDLREILQPRDWIKPTNASYSTYYEILDVDEQEITLRNQFAETNHTGATTGRKPDYVGDDTIVSADVLGKTEDGEPSGTWISTAAMAIRDLISELGIPDANVNEASFTQGAIDNSHTVSIAIPSSPEGSAETVKSVVDKLTRSTTSALTLDNDLKLKFRVLLPFINDNITTINDEDVINWSVETTNHEAIKSSLIRYRHKDIDRFTLEAGSSALTYDSDFVAKYIGTNKRRELDVYLYDSDSAEIMTHREVYYNSLGRTDIKLDTDLRLENIEIGDQILMDFRRLYKRLGDDASRKKVGVVIGKTVTGNRTTLYLTDMGNVFNRSSIITPNSAPDYTSTTEDEKIKYGYITSADGTIGTDENTANVHLIS